MRIKIWGAQGSLPSPLSPDSVKEKIIRAILAMPDIDTDDAVRVRAYVESLHPLQQGTAKGNTSCVEIRAGGETLIIDAGTGIRNLGLELMKGPCGKGQGRLHILFSHPHWDHIQGFPFFLPAFIPGNQITFYSIHNLEMALTEQQRYLFFPVAIDAAQAEKELALIGTEIRSRYGFIPSMQAQRDYIRLEPGKPFTIGPVTISTLRNHHPGDAYSYRIDDQHSAFVYASDAEYKDLDSSTFQERVNFFKNADAILFDAQYGLRDSWENKVNYGHSSAMIGVDFARRAGAKRLLLGHHEPTYSDDQLQEIQETAVAYQSQDPSLPLCEVVVAYEGLELDLAPPGAVEMQLTSNEEAAVLTPGTQFDEQGVKQLMSLVANARHAEGALDTIVNLSQVERLTTAGLKMLVLSSREIEPGLMVLAAPSASVREVIKLGGYDDHFAIYPTVSDAVKAVQAREALNLPGHLFKDQYQILETLGQSAVGTLLKVFDQRNHRQAALRVLSPAFKVQTVEAFIKQVRRLPDLDHRFLARVFDYDWDADDDLCFVVEEFVTGQRLSDHLAGIDGALEANEAMDLALDLMHVLEYTHSRGIIHGNLRPQDIFLNDEGIKVSGFSLARLEEGRRFLETTAHFLEASHLAPEQILGQPLDARTDLYALGVILYRLFTGRALFEESGQALFRAHLDRAPRRPRDLNPAISRSVEHFMLKLVAKNPNERYASAQQARQVFNSLLLGAAEAGKPARQRLVGRETQLQTLLDRWQEAETGRGQLVFITGEPGVGKTTLTRHLARLIESPIVLVGSCLEEESSPAYQPFRQALQTYFASVPPEISDPQMRRLLSHISDIVPELKQLVPDLQKPAKLEPEQAQMRLISSVTQFIEQATEARPWLLILDDLQWIDEGSAELLRYLGRHLDSTSLMVVGTYRDAEVGSGHPMQNVLQDPGHSSIHSHLSLDRLAKDDVAALLTFLWDTGVPDPLTEAIFQQTGGNPLYVEEVARGLVDDGLVAWRSGTWRFPNAATIRLPRGVYEAVERRIHYLNAETRDVLSQAAVLGQAFRFDDLLEMSGLSEWPLLDHLDLAMERQLIQEVGVEETLRFRHAEIHHVFYNDIGSLRRRRLHHRAGEAIEKRGQPQPDQLAAELAYHFSQAGDLERALAYSIPAAQQAQATYANEAALQWYERSLYLVDQLNSQEDLSQVHAQRLLVYRGMGEALQVMGRWDEAYQIYHTAMDFADAVGDSSARAWYQTSLSDTLLKQSRFTEAKEYLSEAEVTFTAIDDLAGLAQVFHYRGTAAAMQGQYELARYNYDSAFQIRERLKDKSGMGKLYSNLGIVAVQLGDFETAGTHYEKSLTLSRQLNDRSQVASLLNNLGELALLKGEVDKAKTYAEESVSITRDLGIVHHLAIHQHTLADVLRAERDYRNANQLYRESIIIYYDLGEMRLLAEAFEAIANLAASLEQSERSLLLAGAAQTLRESIGTPAAPVQIKTLQEMMSAIKRKVGEKEANKLIGEGRAMSTNEAVKYALEEA